MLFARFALRRLPGIGFFKLFGTGTGEGFTPVPNTEVYAILAVWPNLEQARRQTETASVFRRYRDRATESWTVFLRTETARGRWDGYNPFEMTEPQRDTFSLGNARSAPIVALTRATIRPSILLRFWSRVPAISSVIGKDPNVLFKIGMGEVPWFQQVTFSVWPDAESMAYFARHGGPHAEAIRAVREGRWFSEELYARFRILAESGSWNDAGRLHAREKELV
ncbi:MAG: spheroidene monooxygenase [Pseudomonadota bacterium]